MVRAIELCPSFFKELNPNLRLRVRGISEEWKPLITRQVVVDYDFFLLAINVKIDLVLPVFLDLLIDKNSFDQIRPLS